MTAGASSPLDAPVLLRGERVRLVSHEMWMAPKFHEWMNDPETRHLIGATAYPISMPAEEEFLRGTQKASWEDGVSLAIEAIDVPEPVLIGNLRLHQFHPEARYAEAGILIGERAYRGGGYGTEAMALLCRFAFEELGMERVELRTDEFNTRAIRSYEKVGFVVEGRLRRRAYIAGRYYDEIVMGVLLEEFRGVPGSQTPS